MSPPFFARTQAKIRGLLLEAREYERRAEAFRARVRRLLRRARESDPETPRWTCLRAETGPIGKSVLNWGSGRTCKVLPFGGIQRIDES